MGQENVLTAQCGCRAWNGNGAGWENKWWLHCASCRFWARRAIKACRRTTVKWIGLGKRKANCTAHQNINDITLLTIQVNQGGFESCFNKEWTCMLAKIELEKTRVPLLWCNCIIVIHSKHTTTIITSVRWWFSFRLFTILNVIENYHGDTPAIFGPSQEYTTDIRQYSTMLSDFSIKQFYSLSVNPTNILKPQQFEYGTLQHVFSGGTYHHYNKVF